MASNFSHCSLHSGFTQGLVPGSSAARSSQHLGLCTLWKMIDLFIIGVNAGFASFESL